MRLTDAACLLVIICAFEPMAMQLVIIEPIHITSIWIAFVGIATGLLCATLLPSLVLTLMIIARDVGSILQQFITHGAFYHFASAYDVSASVQIVFYCAVPSFACEFCSILLVDITFGKGIQTVAFGHR
jgi:hypothetical protein